MIGEAGPALLEEALLSGAGPTGDAGNLLLTFPDRRPEDFPLGWTGGTGGANGSR